MFKLEKFEKDNTIGEGKINKKDIPTLFKFCRSFDFQKIDQPTADYFFDVRKGVIHWLNKDTKMICSSLYCDQIKGEVRVELGSVQDWENDFAIMRWKELVANAMEAGIE